MAYSKKICVIKNNFPADYRVYVYSVENAYNSGKKDATYNDIVGKTSSTSSDWCFEAKDDAGKNHFVLNISNSGIDKYYQFYVVNTATKKLMGVKSTLATNALGFDSDNYPCVNLQCAYSSKRNSGNLLSDYNCLGFACSKNISTTLYALDNSTRFIGDSTVNNLRYFKMYLADEVVKFQNNISDTNVGYTDDLQEFEDKIESTDYHNNLSAKSRTLESISVAAGPAKTSYYVGESLELDGLTLNLSYSDSTVEKISYSDSTKSDFTVSGFDSKTAGNKTVSIEYQGLATSFSVNVAEKQEAKTLISISVATSPTKTSYYVGESLELAGLIINLNYSDSTVEKLSYNGNESAFTYSGFDSNTAGNKTVSITYQELSTSFVVNVAVRQSSGNLAIHIRNCENGVLYAKRNGADYTDETVASNLSNKSILTMPYDDVFKTGTNNIYFVFYPDADYIPSERPYGVITYVDANNNEQSFNLPFNEATITQSETQTAVSTYYCDIAVNVTRKTFAFGGYGVYYDTTLTSDTYQNALFNLLAGSSEDISEYGLFNIYKTTPNELKSLSKNRFKIRSSDYYYTEIDLSGYITSLVQYPFSIEATNEQPLILGNVATQINSHIVDSVIISNTFEITINGHYKDARDISETTVQCNLPFVDTFEIPSQYINSTIKAEYLTDILTNASVLNIYSDNNLIYSTTCIIGFKLPYTFYNTPFNELSDNLRFKYQNCNITVLQKLNSSDRYNTLAKDVLHNFNGYVQTNEHIDIDSSRMFGNEYNTVKQLLQAGVYIE